MPARNPTAETKAVLELDPERALILEHLNSAKNKIEDTSQSAADPSQGQRVTIYTCTCQKKHLSVSQRFWLFSRDKKLDVR